MIIWLNGPFGVGKTTTARALAAAMPGARVFDPEMTGSLVAACLTDYEVADFQDLPPWRALVPAVMGEIARFTGQRLVAVQSVLAEAYWRELRQGLSEQSLDVFHVVLHADPAVLTERIKTDPDDQPAHEWRLSHIDRYLAACGWLGAAADLVIDTTGLSVSEVANSVLAAAVTHMGRLNGGN